MTLRYGSVCSGVGGCALAIMAAGLDWRAAWFAEIDRFASALLKERFPHVPNLGDFTRIGAGAGPVDLLVGGTPCQSFSIAGKRAGLDDPRGNLTLEYLALARRLRPRWLVWENVAGVLSDDGGRTFGTILGLLGQLGYGFAYRVFDAQFAGVPQRRRRVFLVGHLGDWRRAAAVLVEPESLRGDPPPSRAKGEATAQPLGAGARGSGGYRNDADTANNLIAGTLSASGKAAGSATQQDAENGLLLAFGGNNTAGNGQIRTVISSGRGWWSESDVGGTLRAQDSINKADTLVAHSLRADGFDASEDGTGRGTPLIAFDCKDHGADAGETAPTVRAMEFDKSHANAGGQVAVHQGARVRRLTPLECERLMGFPDHWTAITYRGKPAADGPRYRAIGNGWVIPDMACIFARIDAMERVSAEISERAA